MPRYTLLLAGCLLLTSSATAQTAHPARLNVSVQGGVIRNLQPEDWKQSLYTFYPEVQITSRPFLIASKLSLQGGLRWGYWDDGVREHRIEDLDLTTYSQSSHIAGARFYVVPTQIPFVSLSLFSGLSWHFVRSDYVGGYDGCISVRSPGCRLVDLLSPPDSYPYSVGGYWGRYRGRNYHERFWTLEVGLRVAVPLGNRLAVTTEAQKYIHRSAVGRIGHIQNPFVYKLGLSFGFF